VIFPIVIGNHSSVTCTWHGGPNPMSKLKKAKAKAAKKLRKKMR
jgi:hypothetical protein